MAIKRITVSMPAELARKLKKAAGNKPVSAWLTELVEERLEQAELDRLFEEFYREVAPTREDERRARGRLARLMKARRRRAA